MLLFRPRKKSDECLVGYLIRLSEENCFPNIVSLLNYAGLKWRNSRAPIHDILTGKYDLSPLLSALGVSMCSNTSGAIYSKFERKKDTPYIFVKFPRVCPECLKADRYCKSSWSYLPVVACGEHRTLLVDENEVSGKKLSWYRQKVDENLLQPGLLQQEDAAIQVSEYFESLTMQSPPKTVVPLVLKSLSFREALSFFNFIAHYLAKLKGLRFKPVSADIEIIAQQYADVWKVCETWPESFHGVLNEFIANPTGKRGVAGISKHYRDIHEHLHRQKENKGVAIIKAEFDRFIATQWPAAINVDRVSRIDLAEYKSVLITKREVAGLLNCRLPRIDSLVDQERLSETRFKGKVFYKREEVELLRQELEANWTMAQACRELQLSRHQLKQLLEAGVFTAIQKPSKSNRDWVIDKAHSKALVEDLLKNASSSLGSTVKSYSFGGIQRIGYSIVQLFECIRNGQINYSTEVDLKHPYSLKQMARFSIAS